LPGIKKNGNQMVGRRLFCNGREFLGEKVKVVRLGKEE
jgi:hypothetical protein